MVSKARWKASKYLRREMGRVELETLRLGGDEVLRSGALVYCTVSVTAAAAATTGLEIVCERNEKKKPPRSSSRNSFPGDRDSSLCGFGEEAR